MSDCECTGPGYCPRHGRNVTAIGQRICAKADARSVQAYFGGGPAQAREQRPQRRDGRACAYLGPQVRDEAGRAVTQQCRTCRGNVQLKVFGCSHPGHSADPTTTEKACKTCRDWTAEKDAMGFRATNDKGGLPVKMVAPSEPRPVWMGGVVQVMVTRACDKSCFGCSAGSNLAHKPAVMTPEQFEEAIVSLEGYPGVIGTFGGNPCTSRYFEDYCRILRARVAWRQRGVWTNRLFGHGKLCAITFNPAHSNCNVHLDAEAYAEFERDWPEALKARPEHTTAGLTEDSRHGSPWISMKDLDALPFPDGTSRENTEANRWELIGNCTINRYWSSIVLLVGGRLRAFACEIAGHMAALHADNPDWAGTGRPMPDLGLEVKPGWWRRPMADFAEQFRTCCHHCSVPLNRPGQLAIGGETEEFSETHRFIARPKKAGRPVAFVSLESLERRDRPATEYVTGASPRG